VQLVEVLAEFACLRVPVPPPLTNSSGAMPRTAKTTVAPYADSFRRQAGYRALFLGRHLSEQTRAADRTHNKTGCRRYAAPSSSPRMH
jgi:hypothetical protein